jgi:hypothetical protein
MSNLLKTPPIQLIADERFRQVEAEGFTPDGDDEYLAGQLAAAAVCYATPHTNRMWGRIPALWPWITAWWKPAPQHKWKEEDAERIKELVKAGALIVAEIERIQRLNQFHGAKKDLRVSEG